MAQEGEGVGTVGPAGRAEHPLVGVHVQTAGDAARVPEVEEDAPGSAEAVALDPDLAPVMSVAGTLPRRRVEDADAETAAHGTRMATADSTSAVVIFRTDPQPRIEIRNVADAGGEIRGDARSGRAQLQDRWGPANQQEAQVPDDRLSPLFLPHQVPVGPEISQTDKRFYHFTIPGGLDPQQIPFRHQEKFESRVLTSYASAPTISASAVVPVVSR